MSYPSAFMRRATLLRQLVIAAVLIVALVVAGCGRVSEPESVAPPAANAPSAMPNQLPELNNVDPRRIVTELNPAGTLDAAAAELGRALGVSPDLVRARLIPGGCTLCTTDTTGGNSDPTGLDVAAVAAVVQPGDLIHLFVGRFVCVFSYDGADFAPQSCHVTTFAAQR